MNYPRKKDPVHLKKRKKELLSSLAHLESLYDQLESELTHLNSLLKKVGFEEGILSLKVAAQEIAEL